MQKYTSYGVDKLNTLQRRYNAGDGSHKIEPRYKWYRAITTSALSAPPTNPKTHVCLFVPSI